MKCIYVGLFVVGSLVCFGENAPTKGNEVERSLQSKKAVLERVHAKKTGGLVRRPGVQKGSVAFLNAAGDRIPVNALNELAALLEKAIHVSVRNETVGELPKKGLADVMAAKKANAAVFIVWRDDCDVPMLFAPEQHWAVINARTLKEGVVDDSLFKQRLAKEAARAFAYVCGAGGSTGGGDLMDARDIAALDQLQLELPFDILARFENHLVDIGVTPWEEVTYIRACEEGWAPAPTNDVQKAIWDKVHAMPTEPLKIKPEEKKTEK